MTLGTPQIGDGAQLWRISRDSGTLDLNSPYSYLLWCRDFAATSVAARTGPTEPDGSGGHVAGFVTGYVRPEAPDTVVVWQIAVEAAQRGRGLASQMLHHLTDRLVPAGVDFLEATVTPSNEPSNRLFGRFARDSGAAIDRRTLFAEEHFPVPHEPEVLIRIGPLARRPADQPGPYRAHPTAT